MTLETDLAVSTILTANDSRGTLEPQPAGATCPRLSEDAAEVFAAIAPALVPLACDGYTVLLEREGENSVRLESVLGAQASVANVVVPIFPSATDRGRGYNGSLTLHLSDRH